MAQVIYGPALTAAPVTRLDDAGRMGWSMYIESEADGIGAAAALFVDTLANSGTITQPATPTLVEILSDDANDNGTVTVVGVGHGINAGRKIQETLTVNGTTVVTGTLEFRYVENLFLGSTGSGGVITCQHSDDTDIMTVSSESASIWSGVLHRYSGHFTQYITMMHSGFLNDPTDNVKFELRWFPDDADTTNYMILAAQFHFALVVNSNQAPHQCPPLIFPQPLRIPAGGRWAVYSSAGAASCEGYCMLQGFDVDEGGAGGTVE